MKKNTCCFWLLILLIPGTTWGLAEDDIPQRVSVLPVFFVPRDEVEPGREQIDKLSKHLTIAQQCYKEMLKGRDTFAIVDAEPKIVRDRLSLVSLKKFDDNKRTQYLLNKLFKHFKVNRFNCPYVFLVVIMCPKEPWPTAGGRPFNGGFNGGGGIAIFSSNVLDADKPSIQASLQHELGHAFGLVHVDSYGYDQHANKSIMSYNKENHWSGYNPPKEPGILIPENIWALSMNKRVFPNLYFDSAKDTPQGYKLCRTIVQLTYDTDIPGQKPYNIDVRTNSGQGNGTDVNDIVLDWILPNRKSKKGTGLIAGSMWMSGKAKDVWVNIELEFPIAVRMNRICVHSQCGGGLYPVKAVRVEAETEGFNEVGKDENVSEDEVDVSFMEVKAKRWRLSFKPDESGQVVIRGLRFYSSQGEIFSQLYPTYLVNGKN